MSGQRTSLRRQRATKAARSKRKTSPRLRRRRNKFSTPPGDAAPEKSGAVFLFGDISGRARLCRAAGATFAARQILALPEKTSEQFCDLDGVKRSSLQQLIAGDPERKSVFKRAIAPNAPDFAIVLARGEQRHWVTVVLRLIDKLQSRRLRQNLVRLLDGNWFLELGAHGNRMSAVNRNAHARHRGTEFRQMHDPPAFVLHFHFFLRVAARQKRIHMREKIEGDRVRIHFGARWWIRRGSVGLRAELFDRARAAAGHGLVAGGDDAPKKELRSQSD